MNVYQLHNMVEDPLTRTVRAQAPVHYNSTQFVLDTKTRLIPKRPITLSEQDVRRNIDEIRDLSAKGICDLRMLDGRKVNLETLEPASKSAMVAVPVKTDLGLAKDKPFPPYNPAPGEPGAKEHAAASQPAPVDDVPVVAEATVASIQPPTENEMANAFDGPTTPEEADGLEDEDEADVVEAVQTDEVVEAPIKRKRGRPRKVV